MVSVRFKSDRIQKTYIVKNITELKRCIEDDIGEKIPWKMCHLTTNGTWISDTFKFLNEDSIEIIGRYRPIHGDGPNIPDYVPKRYPNIENVVKRFFSNPLLRKPEFHMFKTNDVYGGVYVCAKCEEPIVSNTTHCVYCNFNLDALHVI